MSYQSSSTLSLGIPDVRIVSTKLVREQEVVIEVESTQTTVVCHRCGRTISAFDGYDEPHRFDYHAPSGRLVRIAFRPKRFRCSSCDTHPTTSQQLRWPPADVKERELGR
jgi:ribosomal protein L37E